MDLTKDISERMREQIRNIAKYHISRQQSSRVSPLGYTLINKNSKVKGNQKKISLTALRASLEEMKSTKEFMSKFNKSKVPLSFAPSMSKQL